MLLVDAHVHLHDCFDFDLFCNAADRNFRFELERHRLPGRAAYLLLAETAEQNWFKGLQKQENGGRFWRALPTGEPFSLLLAREGSPDGWIYLAAGRQIVTAEKLEVLGLLTEGDFEDGKPLAETISAVRKAGGLPVLPWGAGKWLGERGKILKEYLQQTRESIFLGDNGGRPVFWPRPRLFRLAEEKKRVVLPGSDPLPLAGEYRRVGAFGLAIEAALPGREAPAAALKQILLSGPRTQTYGSRDSSVSFCRKQLALRSGKKGVGKDD